MEQIEDPEEQCEFDVGDVRFIDGELNEVVDVKWDDPYSEDREAIAEWEVVE